MSTFFTVEATGTEPLTYQWQKDTLGDGNFVDIPGETGTTLEVLDDASKDRYRVAVSNPCGNQGAGTTIYSEPVKILPPACEGVESIFAEMGNTVWFMSRGDVTDATDPLPAGEYTGGMLNRQVDSIHPTNGVASKCLQTGGLDAGWLNCDETDVFKFTGNNTGNGSAYIHTRNSTQPNGGYANGEMNYHIHGGFFKPGYSYGATANGSLQAIGKYSVKGFLFADPGMFWNALTGQVSFIAEWFNSANDERLQIDVPADPNFVGWDENQAPIWRHIAWRFRKTNSSADFDLWKDGVYAGNYSTTQTTAGTLLSNEDWWVVDDGSASRDSRSFVWGYGNNRYAAHWCVYPFCGDPVTMDTTKFAEMKAEFDRNLERL